MPRYLLETHHHGLVAIHAHAGRFKSTFGEECFEIIGAKGLRERTLQELYAGLEVICV